MLKELKMQQKAIKAPEKKHKAKIEITWHLIYYIIIHCQESSSIFFIWLIFFSEYSSCIVYMFLFKFFLYSKFFKPVQIFKTG